MNHLSNLKRETRYGLPTADQILFNRFYVIGYSYYFRQAKWALEIIDPDKTDVSRLNNFRPDYRIPERFRADLDVYEDSGYDRGHLVSSANQIEVDIQNSETFLLSNMAPQRPMFNRGIWKRLEEAVRKLDEQKKVFETYVITGPLFFFDQEIEMIGDDNEDIKVSLPIPHAFFKSVLVENNTGTINMWSFIIPNKITSEPLETFLVETSKVEKISGLLLWDTLVGTKMNREKNKIRKMWKH
ncbi:DNA/RNA non-specific endonuclease [Winogradskyella jejuensis]|uniref:Endonuclease n=1 Tax=Winogradskyella jejuensis TaxID=1089305 RepID=A0A1M5KKI9_9FLAO|nr:DNA/RNA non-specific endonuclease [Winogradskyella jejuensis]SHG53248.1 endonuclease G [Winogradskyella jejuensis]